MSLHVAYSVKLASRARMRELLRNTRHDATCDMVEGCPLTSASFSPGVRPMDAGAYLPARQVLA